MKTVYFIKPIGYDGPIKIGCSDNPMSRCDGLDVWSPFPLEVLAEIDGGFTLERRFHRKFASDHQRKEWFAASPELVATIDQIRAGLFDIDTLPPPRQLPRSRGWTAEQKLGASYTHKVRHTERRSGYRSPVGVRVCTELDAFLAEPHVHGIALVGPEGAKARRAYHATLAEKATSAHPETNSRIAHATPTPSLTGEPISLSPLAQGAG